MRRGTSRASRSWAVAFAALWALGCDCGGAAVGEDAGADAGGEADAGGGGDAGADAGLDGGPVVLLCNSCHGNERNAAPPRDTDGGTSLSLVTVGVHQSHLGASIWHREVLCEDCHVVPKAIEDPGHIDLPPAELVFGAVPRASGTTPTWTDATCTNWCHGAKLTGGALTAPVWNVWQTAQAYCGDCHGIPPPLPHPQGVGANCATCHPNAAPGLGFSDASRHVDGVVDVNLTCTSCHGDAQQNQPAPPQDTQGGTATARRGVGAHRAHLGPSSWHHEVQCTDCHAVPQAVDDPGHIDSPLPAELTWSFLATARGAAAAFDGNTCTVYCHGVTIDGGTLKTPTWTTVNGSQAQCGTCHSLPPGGSHPVNPACNTCHAAVIAADGGWVDPSLHVNGIVEAAGGCGTCHDLPPNTGAHRVHVGLAGDAGAAYGSVTTAASLTNPTAYAFGCGNCHPVNPARHMNGGLAEVELYDPTAGGLKALHPANASYVPGGSQLLDNFNLRYTLGTCSNVYCHSDPSYATPAGVPRPDVDFAFTGYPVAYPAYALTVGRTYATVAWSAANPGCGGCHGFPIRTRAPQVTAMAGQSHSYLDAAGAESGHGFNHNLSAPLSCRTCHNQTVTAANAVSRTAGVSVYGAVPIVGFGRHVNGRPDVVFDTANPVTYRTAQSLATATYVQGTATCNNVACHKSQTAVRHGTPYRPDNTTECNVCHQF